jgi:hypothetical protein
VEELWVGLKANLLGEDVIWDLFKIIIISRSSFDFLLGQRLKLFVLKLFAPNTDIRYRIDVSETLIFVAIDNLSDFKG